MLTLEELLLQLSLCDLDFHGLVYLLVVAALVVGVVLNGGGEEGVDEGRLSKARFASNLRELAIAAGQGKEMGVGTMMVKAAPRFATILCLRRRLGWMCQSAHSRRLHTAG
jgi:hypothetical protein